MKLYLLGASCLAIAFMAGCEPLAPQQNNTTVSPTHKTASARSTRVLKIPERRIVSAPDSGVELGMGWDSERGEVIPNNCLSFAPIRSTGQTIEMDLSEVSDHSEMMEKMNVSAEVSVKTMFASGSAKSSFAKDTKMTSDSTTLLLRTTVNNGVLMMGPPNSHAPTRDAFPAVEPPSLPASQIVSNDITNNDRRNREARSGFIGFKDEVKKSTRNPQTFREHCGDYFVAAVHSGAEMFTTFTFTASSKAEKKKISASVKGNYGMVSGSVSGNKESENNTGNSQMSMRFVQVGGGASMIPMSKEALEEKLAQLAIEADLTPRFHTMELRSYAEIPGAREMIYESNEDEFEIISDYYWLLSSLSTDIDNVLENATAYSSRTGLQGEDLRKTQDEIIEVRRALAEIIDAYLDGRLPEPDVLDAVSHQWFANDTKKEFIIDFVMPAVNSFSADDHSDIPEDPCLGAAWFDCVIEEVKTSVPYQNPNTLNLLLPMPLNAMVDDGTQNLEKLSAQCKDVISDPANSLIGETLAQSCKAAIDAASKAVTDLDAFKADVLEYRIAQQSRRVCAREPRDNECMTHAEIAALAPLIPVP